MEIMRFEKQPKPSYPIKCAQCGKDDLVPFMPTEGRPCYCSDCFEKIKQERRARTDRLTNNNSWSYQRKE